MNKRTWIIVGVVAALLIALPIGWYLVSPLFIDNTVDEAFPFEMPDAAALANMSEAEMKALEAEFMAALPDDGEIAQLADAEKEEVEAEIMKAAAMVMSDKEMVDPMPETTTEWQMISNGRFTGADDFHQGSGNAVIYQQGQQRVLRFEDFNVTNGPDLHVILSKHPNPTSSAEVGEDYLDLGKIKGNLGNQNYEIPDGVAISDYQSVVIYCVPFHVVFATASLNNPVPQ